LDYNYPLALASAHRTPANTLVIDDFRTLSFPATTVRRRETAAIALYSQPWDEVWLDHDLEFALTEEQFRTVGEYNIRPLIEKIVEDAKNGIILPVGRFLIHSSNGMGRLYMRDKLSPYYPVTMVDASQWTEKHTFPSWAHRFWGVGTDTDGD